jgi:hypothetical protein
MLRTKRLGLVLTPAEKSVLVRMAEAEGGLSQAALVRRLIRHAARERGLWPPERQQQAERPGVEEQ